MEENKKRCRSANFDMREKTLLVDIIDSNGGIYRKVLEGKKTDKVTNRRKEEVWEEIRDEFNACSHSNIKRDGGSLKELWGRLKKEAKRNATERRKEVFATGGGPAHADTEKGEEGSVIGRVSGMFEVARLVRKTSSL